MKEGSNDLLTGPTKDGPKDFAKARGLDHYVKVLQIDLRPDEGRPLKAFVDVEIDGGLIIRSLRVVQHPGKRPQVIMPQISIKPTGKPPYFRTIITMPDAMKGAVDLAVLCAWKEAMAEQKEQGRGRLGQSSSQTT